MAIFEAVLIRIEEGTNAITEIRDEELEEFRQVGCVLGKFDLETDYRPYPRAIEVCHYLNSKDIYLAIKIEKSIADNYKIYFAEYPEDKTIRVLVGENGREFYYYYRYIEANKTKGTNTIYVGEINRFGTTYIYFNDRIKWPVFHFNKVISFGKFKMMIAELLNINEILAINKKGKDASTLGRFYSHRYNDLKDLYYKAVDCLNQINNNPSANLEQCDEFLPVNKIRRLNNRTIVDYAAGLPKLTSRYYSESYDIYEHRQIKQFILRIVDEINEACFNDPKLHELREIGNDYRLLLKQYRFLDVHVYEEPLYSTNLFINQKAYSKLYELMKMDLETNINVSKFARENFNAAACSSIYEYWVYFTLIEILMMNYNFVLKNASGEIGKNLDQESERIDYRKEIVKYIKEANSDGKGLDYVELINEALNEKITVIHDKRTYKNMESTKSSTLRPDIQICIEKMNSGEKHWYAFDAKCKAYDNDIMGISSWLNDYLAVTFYKYTYSLNKEFGEKVYDGVYIIHPNFDIRNATIEDMTGGMYENPLNEFISTKKANSTLLGKLTSNAEVLDGFKNALELQFNENSKLYKKHAEATRDRDAAYDEIFEEIKEFVDTPDLTLGSIALTVDFEEHFCNLINMLGHGFDIDDICPHCGDKLKSDGKIIINYKTPYERIYKCQNARCGYTETKKLWD